MPEDCIFCQIAKKEIPKDFILETEDIMVFPDIAPVAPVHLLIVPKKHIEEFVKISDRDQKILKELLVTLQKLVKEQGLETRGYRLVTNGGGAQLINHFHIHLMGGVDRERKF